jgi:hypothetical protein
MNQTSSLPVIFLLSIFLLSGKIYSQTGGQTEWVLSQLATSKNKEIRIAGNPQIISCKYGKSLYFNGITDGLFIDQMPLSGLKQFTIEVIVRPRSGGNFEQRFFHSGEIKGDRVLLEIRTTKTGWYLDAFINSGDGAKTLIEPNLTHPLDQWYHVAFVVDNGKLSTYVNGQKELEATIKLTPLKTGKTSIGVRQNEQSWFKGDILKIRISPWALTPKKFLQL